MAVTHAQNLRATRPAPSVTKGPYDILRMRPQPIHTRIGEEANGWNTVFQIARSHGYTVLESATWANWSTKM